MPVHALIEVEDAGERAARSRPQGDLRADGCTADGRAATLLEAVRALAFPAGRVHAFVHGEAGMVRAVRAPPVVDRGVPPRALSASGYWKRSRSDEGWREDKAEWKRLVDEDAPLAELRRLARDLPREPAASLADMCRNIRTLHNFEPPATEDEIHASALQYVRKISGIDEAVAGERGGVRARGERDRGDDAAAARRARHLGAAARSRRRGREGARALGAPLRRLVEPVTQARLAHRRRLAGA